MSDAPLDGAAIVAGAPVVRDLVARCAAAEISLDGAYLVGGAVRDVLLGVPVDRDVDLAVEGDAPALARVLAAGLGGEVVAEHEFGTATVVVPAHDGERAVRIDLAGCRTEVYDSPGALPRVQLGCTIEEDLHRRDVSVNAVAVALERDTASGTRRIVDPFGGVAAIGHRSLRVLHEQSLVDDPTRVFRIARYAGRLGFHVHEHTRELAIEAIAAGALASLSADRVRTELELVLQEQAWDALTLLASWGVMERLEHRLERAFHPPLLIRAIDAACAGDRELDARAARLRLAALARGLGDDVGGWMRWLGFSADAIGAVSEHVHVLGVVLGDADADRLRTLPNSELYRALGELTDESFALASLALDAHPQVVERLVAYRSALRTVRLSVRGEDVLAAGVPAGPAVGRILGELFLRSLDGELAGVADERAALERLAADASREEGAQ